jgi:tetratricopeptide (TPR) repeat protein
MRSPWIFVAAVYLVLLVVYFPSLNGGFLWDDDTHISKNAALRSLEGLWHIWATPGATSQYYPLTFSLFWFEYQLWTLHTVGYHVVNVLLHGTAALLLWQVLRVLRVRGAWLACALFALHPVCVMSVAWMTETKNTLSATLALCAAWAYLRAAGLGVYAKTDGKAGLEPRFYGLCLLLFALAMFAKTAVSFLPVTLLLVTWWTGSRLTWRNVWPVLPMVALAIGMGLLTIHVEQSPMGGARGAQFEMPFVDRLLISGRSFWFYLGKLLYPRHLAFIYERWNVNSQVGWQYLFPLATAGALGLTWCLRGRLGRGIFAALAHFYVSTSLLVLIVTLFFTSFSYVSDHWQYFGCMSVLTVVAAGIVWFLDRVVRGLPAVKMIVCVALLTVLGVLSFRQCGNYKDLKTLWVATLKLNPTSVLALDNYGSVLQNEGDFKGAMVEYEKALAVQPTNTLAHFNLAGSLLQMGQFELARKQYEVVLQLEPDAALAHINLGNLLLDHGKADEAIGHFQTVLRKDSNNPDVHYDLANALWVKGDGAGAIAELQTVIRLQPDDLDARCGLAALFFKLGRVDEAAKVYQQIIQKNPGYAPAQNGFMQMVWALATSPDPSVRDGGKAVGFAQALVSQSQGRNALHLSIMSAALAEIGNLTDATDFASRAHTLAAQQGNTNLVTTVEHQLAAYHSGEPYHESPPAAEPAAPGGAVRE